jgi:hypothetical protein
LIDHNALTNSNSSRSSTGRLGLYAWASVAAPLSSSTVPRASSTLTTQGCTVLSGNMALMASAIAMITPSKTMLIVHKRAR